MDHVEVVVVGGGVAGVSAAIEVAKAGLRVALIDENPIGFELMALDIPLHFGQRAISSVANKASMLERVLAANPLLGEAEQAGVDVQLGTSVWSSDGDGILGVADGDRSWLLKYDRAIFAPGARDVGVPFNGWEKAGCMGAAGFLSLVDKYQGFSGRRIAVLGSGTLGLHVALRALDTGVEVAGIVEVSPEVRGRPDLHQRLLEAGVPMFLGHCVAEARGLDEVQSLALSPIGQGGQPSPNGARELECDTVCLAVGLIPNLETIYWTGCDIVFDEHRGGFVPRLDDNMRSSMESVYVVGDGAGLAEELYAVSDAAAAQGRIAAISAAHSLGAIDSQRAATLRGGLSVPEADRSGTSTVAYRLEWSTSQEAANGRDVPVCPCESVTRSDIVAMIERGPVHPDHIKRVTRAGMGYCQGRRCREPIQHTVAQATNQDISEVPLASYRPPFRPLPLGVLQNADETPKDREAFEGAWNRMRRREYERSLQSRD